MISKIAVFVLLSVFLSGVVLVWEYVVFYDGKLHVVFCDVGQGDAIFIRTPRGTDILLDGGPDDKVLSCLSKHMPFWDRDIELMMLSHPHEDHLQGLPLVLEQYRVKAFAQEELTNSTISYHHLIDQLTQKHVPARIVYKGDRVKTPDGIRLEFLGPSREFLTRTSPNGTIGESKEFASLITLLTDGSFHLLLTGDSQVEGLLEAVDSLDASLSVLQVPHHGSKYGLDSELVDKLHPSLVVISVGRKNRYGHPSKEILHLFAEKKIRIRRTDQSGDIEIVSDGKKWVVNH